VPELSLDQIRRLPLACEFERVRVAQPVRMHALLNPGPGRKAWQQRADVARL